jgi:protein O-GlcNAc transferase
LLIPLLILALGDLLAEGQRAFQAGDLALAEQKFRAHLKTAPRSAEALSNLAAVLARREQFNEAIALYRKALTIDPKLTPVHFNLGVAQMRSGDFVGCAASFDRFLQSHPGEARARQLSGLCRVQAGDLAGGIAALEAGPLDPSAAFLLAYAHAQTGDEKRAAELLGVLESNPAQARMVEGLLEFRRARYIEAKEKFEAAVAVDPNLAPAIAGLGKVALADNRDPEAMAYFERALKLAPQDAESTYQLGVLAARNGDVPRGRELLRRAIELRANYADPYYQLAQLDFKAGQYPAALTNLQAASKILPDHDSIRMLLGRTYQALGRKADADREFAEVRRLKAKRVERDQLQQKQ